jgi:hypothetical protein
MTITSDPKARSADKLPIGSLGEEEKGTQLFSSADAFRL